MFYNRDLSWLGFNLRVLQEAADKNVPLYERMKFLAIFSSNLDEFFRVRYPYILAFSKLGRKTQLQLNTDPDDELPSRIQSEIESQLKFFGKILEEDIISELHENGIIFYYNMPILETHLREVREIFLSEVLSYIQPIVLDENTTQKFIPENNRLYFVVTLKEPEKVTLSQAVVNIPSEKLPRFFVLSPQNGIEYVIFIDDIIRENLSRLFPGMEIHGAYSFKLNRSAELVLDLEYSPNLLQKIEKQLKKRDFGAPSRLLHEPGLPRNVQLFLASEFDVKPDELFAGGRYHNIKDLADFPRFNKSLTYEKRRPLASSEMIDSGDVFNVLDRQDILLHIPYHSYNLVLAFFNQAAVDPKVTDIYITLYRVATESHVVNALISAAKNGKRVTVFIELKARFDEANNIRWSKTMKQAGVNIIYSLPDIKVHSKIGLIKKQSGLQILSYAILSTGNFNEVTAQFYTDHVLLTTDPTITSELISLFDFLKKNDIEAKTKMKFEKLLVSQFNMYERFVKLIDNEIEKAARGEDALIRIKINNLEEPHMITHLYKASQSGVKVHLIVRSVCCLMPGVPDLSENIIVRRLVDRYLEHTRLFIFGTGNPAEVIMGSADWMNRNLHSRIEVCVAITNPDCKKELIDYFEIQWSDNDKMTELTANLEQHRVDANGYPKINAQQSIYHYLQESQ